MYMYVVDVYRDVKSLEKSDVAVCRLSVSAFIQSRIFLLYGFILVALVGAYTKTIS